MLHIVMLSEWFLPDSGGAESHLLELIRACRSRGHRVSVVTTPSQFERYKKSGVKAAGAEVYSTPSLSREFLACREKFSSKVAWFWAYIHEAGLSSLDLFRRLKPDIIHCHSMSYTFVGALLGKILGVPFVLTIHVNHLSLTYGFCSIWCRKAVKARCLKCRLPMPYRGPLTVHERFLANRMKYLAVKDAAAVLAPSRYVLHTLRTSGYGRARLYLAPTWIRPEKFARRPPVPALLKKYGIRAGEKILLYVGRIFYTKGIEFLVRALSAIFRRHPDCRLLIVGRIETALQDHYEIKISRLIKRLGLEKRIIQTGSLPYERVQEIYSLADALVLPSLTETQGLVLLEAMASGVPVVVTSLPAPMEFIRHGTNGLLVKPRDSASLAGAVNRLLGDEALRQKLIVNGLKTVSRRFTYDRLSKKVMDIYDRVRRSRPPPDGPEL